ncbi:hypothetical protein [Endozoicomonas lisbonensis]|uniref:Uncharacterized protein n=1 Tax=Endozoicomonas lisbonensis TaxID=3120522 RepID=A0ABV2SMH0_9GAMM
MKYRVGNNVICSILVVVISAWAGLAFPAEPTYNLTHFLKATDPVKLPASESIGTNGETIAHNIHNAQWDAPLLRSPEGFEALRYAYEHQLVDKNEFLDAQDYLQIQADFAAPETEAFQILVDKGQLPVRVPAVSVKRVFYTAVADEKQPPILISEGALAGEQFGWLTVIRVDSGFFSKYKMSKNTFLPDKRDRWGDILKLLNRKLGDKRQQLLYWYEFLEANMPELMSVRSTSDEGGAEIVMGSIPLYLAYIKKTSEHFLDFTPLYGQLDWNNLIEMRVAGANPGTIYHPNVTNNYFYPHHLYGGASAFVRHDLKHHLILGIFSESHRRFMAWMHQQEEVILKKMDSALVDFNKQGWHDKEVVYNETRVSGTGMLGSLCHSEQRAHSHLRTLLPLKHYWAKPGNHRTLFPGSFADSAFSRSRPLYPQLSVLGLEAWSPSVVNWRHIFLDLLTNQCADAGYYFSASFDLYHALLEEVLTENRSYIWDTFGINVEEILK